MERPLKLPEDPRYEMTRFGTPRLERKDTDNENKTERRADQTKPKPTPAINRQQTDVEKIVEIRQFDMSYDGGVYEVIANSNALPQDEKPLSGSDRPDALYDALNSITQATQQQMDLNRRMMYFITVLLFIVFLTAATSLALTVQMLMSENSSISNQPTSSPGRTCKVHTPLLW